MAFFLYLTLLTPNRARSEAPRTQPGMNAALYYRSRQTRSCKGKKCLSLQGLDQQEARTSKIKRATSLTGADGGSCCDAEGPKAHRHLLIWFAFLEEPAGFVLTHARRGTESEFHSRPHPWLLETLSCTTRGTNTPRPDGMGSGTRVALSQLPKNPRESIPGPDSCP